MNTVAKLDLLKRIANKLKKTDKIICSDEGNLPCGLENNQQKIWVAKPKGVWHGHGGNWLTYLLNNDNGFDGLWCQKRLSQIVKIYRVKLSSDVFCVKDFTKFEKKWANANRDGINWHKFSQIYAGIDIPYNRRMDSDLCLSSPWLWSWDIGSGCVWDESGYKSVETLCEFKVSWKYESKLLCHI